MKGRVRIYRLLLIALRIYKTTGLESLCLIRVSNGGLIWQRIRMILMKLLHRFLRVWIPFLSAKTVVGKRYTLMIQLYFH